MIRIKPDAENQFNCPRCSQKPVVKGIQVQPIFTLAELACENCNFEFLQTLPVGHTTTHTLTIDKSNENLYPANTEKTWLSEALLKAHRNEKSEQVHVNRIIYKNYDRVIVLNTLDFLYGHVLLKLYNAIALLDNYKNLGLVIILPKSFEWLIPNGCAEAWVVDLKLNDLTYFYASIQEFVSKEFERFDTIFLSKSYSHPDFHTINIARLTSVAPFSLKEFMDRQPTFTFVLRQDRWWMRYSLDYWFYRICRKLKALKYGSVVLSMRQNSLVKKTISIVRKKIPDANFHVVGLGTAGNFKGYAHDNRKGFINDLLERKWCALYAKSHVIIGVHGSNMLLPTAHAAGCVEILSADRYGNIVQDISVRYTDRKQLYFYRFADQYSSPKIVANKVISIIENFDVFEKNMCRNIYPAKREPLPAPYATIFTSSTDDAHR